MVHFSECYEFPPRFVFFLSLLLSATFPLDLTKTRLQIQGEAALARLGDGATESAPYRGMVRTALFHDIHLSYFSDFRMQTETDIAFALKTQVKP